MSHALIIPVRESLNELRACLKKASPMIQTRIKMLIAMKRAGKKGSSKRELMDTVGACSQSVHNWRTLYKKQGLSALLSHGRVGFKPALINQDEHKKLEKKLRDPENGLRGYVELQDWIEKEFDKTIKYNTLLKYCIRHFGSKAKVARKSHIRKNPEAVESLKKTSDKLYKK